MKFFDYKFLILLGLTLVVYFIYREVEYLRSKVEKLESDIKKNNGITFNDPNVQEEKLENKPNTNSQVNKKPVLALPKPPTQVIEEKTEIEVVAVKAQERPTTPKSPPKVISLGLNITSIGTNESNEKSNENIEKKSNESGIKVNPFQIINDITNQTDNSDTEETSDNDESSDTSDSSNHVAIYSNDNDQLEETQNSLLESVEANKKEINFQYETKIPNIDKTVDDIINSISTDNNDQPVLDEKPEENNKESSDDLKEDYDENKLNGMKLPDVKKIAENMKISLTKKINGQPKPKNKQELISEILKK